MKLEVIDNHRSVLAPPPTGWHSRRMNFAVKQYQHRKNEDENPTVLSLTKAGIKVKTNLNFGKSAENYIGHQIVERGQFVFTPRDFDATPILCGISKYYGCISNLYIVFDVSEEIDGRFLEYFFWGLKYGFDFFEKLSFGMRYSFNKTQFEHIPLIHPDLDTQRLIADFLDRETARIDLLIEKKQRLVKLLGEERSSAISSAVTVGLQNDTNLVPTTSNYLPQIPSTWRVWRLKHLANIRGGLTLGRTLPDNVPLFSTPYMRVANVQAGWINFSDVAEVLASEGEIKRYQLKTGDVLMNEGGDNDKLGRGAVWDGSIELCLNQNHVFAARPHDIRYSEWVSLATNARYARDFFFLNSNQSTNLASISKTKLGKFPIAIPPFEEMVSTMSLLNERLQVFDKIMLANKASITRLKEYRSSLITAAVTGQIDVTTYAKSGTTDRQLDAIQEGESG